MSSSACSTEQFHPPALHKAASLWAFGSVVPALLARAAAQHPVPLGRGELRWETSLSQASGGMVCPVVLAQGRGGIISSLCCLENGDQKPPLLQRVVAVGSISLPWSLGLVLPAPPSQGLALLRGRQGSVCLHSHTCFSIPSPSTLPSTLQAAYLRQGTVMFLVCVSPLPLRSSRAVEHCRLPQALTRLPTWLGTRSLFYFLLLTSLCLSTPFGIKKGDEPNSGKQFGGSACSVVLCFPGDLYISGR